MGSRIKSHMLSSGLVVSGPPENSLSNTRQNSLSSSRPPFTSNSLKHSHELAKMFDVPTPGPSRPNSGPGPSRPNSGPRKSNSGQFGPTGLITSGPHSGPVRPGTDPGLGRVGKKVYGSGVTDLGEGGNGGVRVWKGVMWVVLVGVFMVALTSGVLVVLVKNVAVSVVGVGAVVGGVLVVVGWNLWRKRSGTVGYWKRYPDAELRGAVDGQYVKVTGVVTCGSIPLESSFQKVPRCVYASTELFEYRGCGGKPANPKHRFFSWGCRHAEKYVADFYISDFQSGQRAQVKSGYGAKVSVFVKPATIVDSTKNNRDSSPNFLQWLSEHGLSTDDRIMRLKEGYIKEGSTVSVIGTIRRHDNVLMIVPPAKPVSTSCQWFRCLLPTSSEGLILLCDESQTEDVIAV